PSSVRGVRPNYCAKGANPSPARAGNGLGACHHGDRDERIWSRGNSRHAGLWPYSAGNSLSCGASYAPRRHVPSAGNTSQYGGSWQLNLERKYLIVEEAVSLKTRHDWELYTHLAARFGPVLATDEETCCRWFSSRSGRGSWITSGFLCGFFRAA